jgi:hypothetical protein
MTHIISLVNAIWKADDVFPIAGVLTDAAGSSVRWHTQMFCQGIVLDALDDRLNGNSSVMRLWST